MAAQRVVDTFNRVIGPELGVMLRTVRGLTDAQAGRGRPQSRINPLVRTCDLFVAVFDKRYGTPTGVAQSGTEEEFRIADRRARHGGVPHILLFFKELRDTDTGRPDAQLRRVLKFRTAIDRGRKYYRLEYASRLDFQMVFLEQMMQWVWSVIHEDAESSKDSEGSLRSRPARNGSGNRRRRSRRVRPGVRRPR